MCMADMPTLGCRRSHLPPVSISSGERGRSKSDVEQKKKKVKKTAYRFFLNLPSFMLLLFSALNLLFFPENEI